ncbi:MAG: DNA repair protein RadC [Patescibacteria group bacterium]|nr:DNA repair protein RadC [Patescibacteria group bacterium]
MPKKSMTIAYEKGDVQMNQIPKILRPREKMLSRGAETLTDSELLAILLGSGIKGHNVKEVARLVLLKFGQKLVDAKIEELEKIPGIGKTKAMQIISACTLAKRLIHNGELKITLRSAEDVIRFCHDLISSKREKLVALFLDIHQQLIDKKEITRGTVSASLIHPREIYAPALELRASAIILVHNHPAGDPTPSAQDYEITEQIKSAGEIIGIHLLDHLVLAKNGVRSALNANDANRAL